MKKFIFLPLWFVCSLVFTGSCIMGIQKLRHPQAAQIVNPVTHDAVLDANSSIPQGEVKGLSTVVELADARPELVARFLKRYDSPLKPYDEYGKKLVAIADKYSLDYRLLPAIAMQESNLCKKIPSNSYNCLGFGITSTTTLRFESYEEAFDKAASSLKITMSTRVWILPKKSWLNILPIVMVAGSIRSTAGSGRWNMITNKLARTLPNKQI